MKSHVFGGPRIDGVNPHFARKVDMPIPPIIVKSVEEFTKFASGLRDEWMGKSDMARVAHACRCLACVGSANAEPGPCAVTGMGKAAGSRPRIRKLNEVAGFLGWKKPLTLPPPSGTLSPWERGTISGPRWS